jgi:hypothetical protein
VISSDVVATTWKIDSDVLALIIIHYVLWLPCARADTLELIKSELDKDIKHFSLHGRVLVVSTNYGRHMNVGRNKNGQEIAAWIENLS